jgi:hypothetical protein
MTDALSRVITQDVIDSAYSYQAYRQMIDRLLADGKTTGENHSEAMLHYTKMNVHRMKRLDKQIRLSDELKQALDEVDQPQTWLVLTEAWCGDAAQLIPLFNRMAEQNDHIELKLILRDENLEIMDRFLFNGKSRSIPKIIFLDGETLELLGDWGPRPAEAQALYSDLRSRKDVSWQEVAEKLHKWYADDKTESSQQELLPMIQSWQPVKIS